MSRFPKYRDIVSIIIKSLEESSLKSYNANRIIVDAINSLLDNSADEDDRLKAHIDDIKSLIEFEYSYVLELSEERTLLTIIKNPERETFLRKLKSITDEKFSKLCLDLLNFIERISVEETPHCSAEDADCVDIIGFYEDDFIDKVQIYVQIKNQSNKKITPNQLKQFVGGVMKRLKCEDKHFFYPFKMLYFSPYMYDVDALNYAKITHVNCYNGDDIFNFSKKFDLDIDNYM